MADKIHIIKSFVNNVCHHRHFLTAPLISQPFHTIRFEQGHTFLQLGCF